MTSPPSLGSCWPHGNSPPACGHPSSSRQLFVPMPPAGDRLDTTVSGIDKKLPNVFLHWHRFSVDFHLGEKTSRNMVFAPFQDEGFVPRYL